MIESIANSADPPVTRRKAGGEDPLPGAFSYAQASAALEKNAGQSLKAFGGRPEAAATARPGNANSPERISDPGRAARGQPEKDARAPAASPPPGSIAPLDAWAGTTPAVMAPPAQMAPEPARGASTAQAASATAAAAVAPTMKPPAPAGAGSSEPTRTQIAAKLSPPAPPAPLHSPEDIAELIARKLDDGASEFDLRLDPPELGRIEARLTLGDDGAARLLVKFDNQAAYDLFARDEAALRMAFADAGYNFGGGALAFVLEDRARAEGTPAPAAAMRNCLAPVAARALDIRI